MTEAHPIRKLLNDIDAELSALDPILPEQSISWRQSSVGRVFLLEMQSQLVELYLEHTSKPELDMFTKGAISILEDVIEWGLPNEEEEEEDGDSQG